MIKVIVGYRVKKGADISGLLLKLRTEAMWYPGFVEAETLRNKRDTAVIVVIYTWKKVENWIAWEESKVRAKLIKNIELLVQDKTRTEIYDILPTAHWV